MSWDLKRVDLVLKEGKENPRGRIAIVTHNIEGWNGAPNDAYSWSYHGVKAGESVMVTNVVEVNESWTRKATYVTIFVDGRSVNVRPDKLVLVNPENQFEKKAFAITGALSKQREYYKALIKLKGGVWKNSVSNATDILIIGANNRSQETTKYKKAVRLGKRIIKESDLDQLLQS